jgi:hypothetical protein
MDTPRRIGGNDPFYKLDNQGYRSLGNFFGGQWSLNVVYFSSRGNNTVPSQSSASKQGIDYQLVTKRSHARIAEAGVSNDLRLSTWLGPLGYFRFSNV